MPVQTTHQYGLMDEKVDKAKDTDVCKMANKKKRYSANHYPCDDKSFLPLLFHLEKSDVYNRVIIILTLEKDSKVLHISTIGQWCRPSFGNPRRSNSSLMVEHHLTRFAQSDLVSIR